MSVNRPVYLDYQATTPLDQKVLDEMLPYFTEHYGNPASIDHRIGNAARDAVESARTLILQLLGDPGGKLVFTSGATEADNLAIVGYAEANRNRGNHVVTFATEHKAVLEPFQYLAANGFDVTVLPVDMTGMPDAEMVKAALRKDTILVSCMAANNEIGTIYPVKELAEIVHSCSNAVFHCDATQAVGKLRVNVRSLGIDLMSISAHKIYGPKGVGALYIRRGLSLSRIKPLMRGGGHEYGLRSGTLNVPGIVGFAKAVALADELRDTEYTRIKELRDLLLGELQARVDGIEVNGSMESRLAHNLNLFIPGVRSKSLLHLIREDVCISSGAACTTMKVTPSHVIQALGYSPERALSSIRISLGRFTTTEEILFAADVIAEAVRYIRRLAV